MNRALAVALALPLSVALACARNPVTGERQLSLVSESQEIEMGKQAAAEVGQEMPRYPDQKVQGYVSGVALRMAKHSERPNVPWSFTVIDDATVNAFALPGGPIFVTRGILTYMNSEAELASVVGHEIGHVTARHSVQQISKAQIAQLGIGLGSILSPTVASLGQAAGAGLQLLFLKYGRDAERQADELGFKYMTKEGWDPHEMVKMFQTLERVSGGEGGGRLPGYLSTHPDPGERAKTAAERAAKVNQPGLKIAHDEFLALVNGMPFGENPRNGFFKGNAFLHPDLKLQIELPDGWKKQNSASAVAAQSPQGDAIVQLGAAGKDSPAEAAKKFLSQKGIQPAQVPGSQLSGLPPGAASSYFQAQTEQGAIAGLVTFVSHGGATFGILGYTTADKLGTYDAAFKKTMASFSDLKDPAALAAQPPKLELVKVPRDMSVAEFQQQFPSTGKPDDVAYVNGLTKDGRFTAGQTAKRIVGGTAPVASR